MLLNNNLINKISRNRANFESSSPTFEMSQFAVEFVQVGPIDVAFSIILTDTRYRSQTRMALDATSFKMFLKICRFPDSVRHTYFCVH